MLPLQGSWSHSPAARRGFRPKEFLVWKRLERRRRRRDAPSPGFLESQPSSVQCCPLLQTPPTTAKLMWDVAVLRGGEGCKAGFAMYPTSNKSFQLRAAFPSRSQDLCPSRVGLEALGLQENILERTCSRKIPLKEKISPANSAVRLLRGPSLPGPPPSQPGCWCRVPHLPWALPAVAVPPSSPDKVSH